MKNVPQDELKRLVNGQHHQPHALLGMHLLKKDQWRIRVMEPDAATVSVTLKGTRAAIKLKPSMVKGLWETDISAGQWSRYTVNVTYQNGSNYKYIDPYLFAPQLSEADLYLFNKGDFRQAYQKMGAHIITVDGIKGTLFTVWAPTAKRVSVVGTFNYWNGLRHPMRSLGSSGVWEIFIPGLDSNQLYKFEILTQMDQLRIKSDPFGNYFQLRPDTSSITYQSHYKWKDTRYLKQAMAGDHLSKPMNIYEIHLGSWQRKDDWTWYNYREIADRLIPYVKELGFTHIELMPVMEHPFDGSWGYQVTGYFAPSSRFGTPDDLKYFIDQCHQNNISVLLDWVPAHFPKDDFAIARFDGTALYEHEDSRLGEHPDWGTYIFNFGRSEVKNFLISNALYWLQEFHADGLRIDAVASMLYLDYSRSSGEWVPNKFGGNENLEAIEFMKHLNSVIRHEIPRAIIIAEESTSFGGVTRNLDENGLGFHYKWNMGWMNDFLRYMSKDPIYRKYHHNDLTFSMLYQYSEHFILVLSHDEIVHGKRSLISKMPGDDWQKFANYKLLLSFMMTHPGKKLLFMGNELAPWNEWNETQGVEWHLQQWSPHREAAFFLKTLNNIYLHETALWQQDQNPAGFRWIDSDNSGQSIVSFIRQGNSPEDILLIIANFTPESYYDFRQGVPLPGEYAEIFNSDRAEFNGSGVVINSQHATEAVPQHHQPHSLVIGLPPLGLIILKPCKQ